LLLVGISTFQDEKYNLVYADKDAKDVANVFRKQADKGIFKNVLVNTLLNEQATRININKALQDLQRNVENDDVVVLFLTSHGAKIDNVFYLLAHDSNAMEDYTCVSFSEIERTLSRLHCRVLLLIDACHAGTLGDNLIASGAKNPIKGIERALEDLKERQEGLYVLSSSLGEQVSYEDRQYENGLFTEALLEGLAGKANTEDVGEKVIYFHELASYVEKRVPELAKKIGKVQKPIQKLRGNATKLPVAVCE
jgi:uncharacterized caspase-like protein